MKIIKYIYNLLIKDSVILLVNPPKYFLNMRKEASLFDATIKTLSYAIIAAILNTPESAVTPDNPILKILMQNKGFILSVSLLGTIIMTLILMFIGAVLLLIFSKISNGITKYKLCLKISSSILIIVPLNAALVFLISNHKITFSIVSLLLMLYGVWMFYNAMTLTLEGTIKKIKVISFLFSFLFIAFFLMQFSSHHSINFPKKTGEQIPEQFQNYYEYLKKYEDLNKQRFPEK